MGGKKVLSADCERRERQRQMKNDEWQPYQGLRARSFSAASSRRLHRTFLPSAGRRER
jgi:hypothetical protein